MTTDFTEAMSMLAGGVVMVTSWLDGRPWGMTVSAFTSVSSDPPTILVSLRSDSASASTIAESGSFGVSVLARRHRALARHGSLRGGPKYLEHVANPNPVGLSPAIAGALAHLDCEAVEQIDVADHSIFIGRVDDVQLASGGEPLVYFRRGYRRLEWVSS